MIILFPNSGGHFVLTLLTNISVPYMWLNYENVRPRMQQSIMCISHLACRSSHKAYLLGCTVHTLLIKRRCVTPSHVPCVKHSTRHDLPHLFCAHKWLVLILSQINVVFTVKLSSIRDWTKKRVIRRIVKAKTQNIIKFDFWSSQILVTKK
jgi:hypothetical protein